MAARSLTWSRAASIAMRDLRSAPGKFLFVVLSVAVGVAALVGVRGFSEIFRGTLTTEARSLMAGDLSARTNQQASAEELKKIAALNAQGIRTTWVTETVSMVSVPPDPVPILVSLKAVDPAQYPYYGEAVLEPEMPLQAALTDTSVVVADEFMVRMKAKVGDTVRLGGHNFRIAARLVQEPDRMTAGAGLGPRVLISRSALNATGLLAAGSRANERLLVALPVTLQSTPQLAEVRKQLEAALPEAQVMDYREGNPALTQGLDRSTAILSLICLVAMVLGAIGVAMSMHAHLEQRMDVLAILKAVGAGSGDLLRIFLLQTLGLGLAGALLGVLAGAGVMLAMPSVLGNLLPVHARLAIPWRSASAGLATGLLTTLLFCLPPLLDVRKVRPILVLRRVVEDAEQRGFVAFLTRWGQRKLQIVAGVVILAALTAIAAALSDSAQVGTWFGACLAAILFVLLLLSAGFLRLLRWLLNRVRLRLPQYLRQGLANLYRPGNQSAAVLAALGVGVMLILAVYLMQSQVLREIQETASPKLPNMFLVDITNDEIDGIRQFFKNQQGVKQQLDLLPVVSGRFVSLNGTPLDQLKVEHFPKRMLESVSFSWADTLPEGDKVRQGKWWSDPKAKEIAIGEGIASRIHVGVGSAVEIEVNGVTMPLKVAALYRADEEHIAGRASFMLPSGLVKDAPAVWYGAVRVETSQVPAIERALFAAYPTVTVINLADVLDRIESVVHQITMVVKFLAGFSIFAGLMILASSVASTRFRRMREAVVLKTLGATRWRIVRIFSVEFSVLGLLAGTVGVIFANVLTRILLRKLEAPWHIEWGATVIALLGTAALATATGWVASHRILGLRPLEVLREE
ncbi:ABC transporter permease [Acidicapsa dinghuensis]|uniref:ABC transporter permease n=1 Tax=Acidicapsa dinghuensis TaxID=2218256 RepID=A0ABW1EH21_9BACT|nr:FtsX-like permease family protein [Acidicapsa dinghuensis]